MADDIRKWLEELGLGKYGDIFAENAIDVDVLDDLGDGDLKDMGVVALGDRKRLLRAIAQLEADDAADLPEPHAPAAERRQLTVMFCDLVGSTALSRQLDPEDLRDLMRRYQDAVSDAVTSYGGHVAKFLGDGVLAYFGWPQAYEDQAERALHAGLAALKATSAIALDDATRTQARVGIATGLVVVGDLSGELDAITGETPNLAARLQQVAKPDQVVIGEATRRIVADSFELSDLGPQTLKGFSEAVAAFGVIGESESESRFEALHGRSMAIFVGRQAELTMLRDRWSLAKDGEGQVALLSGEAGIGKSRLVEEFRLGLAAEAHARLTHQCSPYHTNSAFYPVIRQLEHATGIASGDDDNAKLHKLEQHLRLPSDGTEEKVSALASLLAIREVMQGSEPERTPQQRKQETFVALIDRLMSLADEAPVLFILEDAHWIDPTTYELLARLVEAIREARVLVVITHRPEWQTAFKDEMHATAMVIKRLGRTHVSELAAAVAGESATGELIEAIVARTDGVPLYVEEFTRSVVESGTGGGGESDLVPESLQASLTARLDRLGDAKEIAQIGAVIGREFPHDLLSALVDRPEAEFNATVDRLVQSELVFRGGTTEAAVYTFKHALVQDVAYESLLRSKRRELHLRIAQALTERFGELAETQPELLAFHFTEGGELEQAVEYWIRAGRYASEHSAHHEAAAHLTKGLELLTSLPSTPDLLQQELALQTTLGLVLMAIKGYASKEAETAYLRAHQLSHQVDDKGLLFPTLIGLRYLYQVRGDAKSALDFGTQCLELGQKAENRTYLAQAHVSLGHTLCITGAFSEAKTHLLEAVRHYDRNQPLDHLRLSALDPGVFALSISGYSYWILGYPDQALDFTRKAMALATELGHPQSVDLALSSSANTHLLRREFAMVRQQSEAALAIARKRGFQMRVAMHRMLRGASLSAEGDNTGAITEIRDAFADYAATGAKAHGTYFLTLLAEACYHDGQIENGLATVDGPIQEKWRRPTPFALLLPRI